MKEASKLNLGCGGNLIDGYINVDIYGNPDVRWDLEKTPWPWEDSSINEIKLIHVLEHLGGTSDIYLNIIKEMYRVCSPDAMISIAVPHPRHDDFINDPTHVRAITPENLALFSKKWNAFLMQNRASNTPLGLYLDVDLEIVSVNNILDEPWASMRQENKLSDTDLLNASRKYNNVIKEFRIEMAARK